MICCNRSPTKTPSREDLIQEKEKKHQSFDEMKITAIALAMIALLLAGTGLILMGVGTTPATMNVGFGIIPYLLGSQFGFLACGVFFCSLVTGAIAAVKGCQYHKLSSQKRSLDRNTSMANL